MQRIDALGHSLRYDYDAAGRLSTLINENNDSARFAYDVRDRLIEETGFDERRTAYQYNAAGELTERLEHGSAPQAAGIFAADPTLSAPQ